MRVVAAYMLAKQAGKDGSAADIKAILSAAGVEADDAKIELLLKEIEGKDLEEMIKEGAEKLASMPAGGAAAGGAAPAAGGAAAAAAEPEPEPEEEEEEEDMGFDLFD
uniref:60S acidic ribosomal protein P2 n=1 Tax=Prasinoderma coloniale TaxID=156133 RepID=A0A7R9T9I0_9VIRI|mmetsp:Transcript_10994/g.45615  ORF Transcript_10994/g.45615 Transcript_10994/m.45615 type:complete len:108 (+) Transcript_10994:115-438(+)